MKSDGVPAEQGASRADRQHLAGLHVAATFKCQVEVGALVTAARTHGVGVYDWAGITPNRRRRRAWSSATVA